ncbi:Anaerobic nitric oxide reductase transcription regulator NorR [subsurface metagenome]
MDGLIRRCNKRAGELLGCPAEELVGKPVFELYADTPQGKDEASKVFQRFLAGERIIDEELQMQKADGTPVWISLTVNAIRDAEGQIVESRSMVVDITERKRAEDALRQANLIVENSPAVLFRWKAAEGWPVELVSENVTQFGYTPEELLSGEVPYASLVHPDDLERVAYEVQEYSASGVERFQQEYRIITKDGQVRCLDDQTVIERDAHGQITHYQGIVLDITQRKQAEKELQKYRDHLEELVKKRTSELTAANKQLKQALSEIQDLKDRLEAENINLREEIKLEHNFEEIIGQSDTLKYVLYKVEEVAPTDSTILILGETGTGKELVARAIHNNSSRKSRPLVKVDCTALPANLIESELFGHERGAFSGAVQQRKGRFEIANASTLFLDEIGELSMELQSKLLRVLECGEFERLGSSKTIYTDVRIIAATNRNLKEEVEKGRFRQDLWYRLNVFSITVPPLKKRPEDIPLLIEWFVAKFTRKMGKTIKTIPKKTMKALQDYHWPGNVRELSNVIESAMISSHDTTLRIPDMLETLKHDSKDKIEIVSMTEMEKDHIVQAIETCHWRIEGKNGAAELLGLNPGTLRGRMRKYGIKRP